MKLLVILALWFIGFHSPLAFAHHGPPSDPSLFNTERLVEMDAEVIEVFWRNPHVRFKAKVQGAFGEEIWEIELRQGPSGFTRRGLNKDFLKPGDKVKVAGYPSRARPNLLGLMNMLLPNGQELVEPNVEARYSDDRLLTQSMDSSAPLDEAALAEAAKKVDGIFRVWGMVDARIPETPVAEYVDYLSDSALILRARYIPAVHDPELKCQSGMPSTMFDPMPMEVKRAGENLILHMAEYDIERTIHMKGAEANPSPSRLGYSVGRWENDKTLVVNTTQVDWPFFDPWGTPQSNKISYEERFVLSEDEKRLDYTLTADDPVMFTEPVVLKRAWRWVPNGKIGEYDCTLWDKDIEFDPVKDNPFRPTQQ